MMTSDNMKNDTLAIEDILLSCRFVSFISYPYSLQSLIIELGT